MLCCGILRKLAVFILTVPAFPAWAACGLVHQPATRQGVLQTEALWVAALEKKNASFLSCLLLPDFSDIDWQGRLRTRRDILDSLSGRPAARSNLTGMRVVIRGDIAIVRGLNLVEAKIRPTAHIRFTDVFLYRETGWHALFAQETLERR